ncbi:putative Exostosin-2 like protein [Fusarium oxysporum f. sp. albedinis]|nr:putative Exostosin-2 like protein [Fusarium oxysporum f. sp. albedinis]
MASNAKHIVNEIHDILEAYYYYNVACKCFINNICHQAMGHCLLLYQGSPLCPFCEQWVLDLRDEKL